MNTKEWVKRHGWKRAQDILKYSNYAHVAFLADGISTTYFDTMQNGRHSLGELSRLFLSYQLVREHGTLERAKEYAESKYTAPEVAERLKQAIIDVVACTV